MNPLRHTPTIVAASMAALFLVLTATQCSDPYRTQPKVPETTSGETPGPAAQPPAPAGEVPRKGNPPAPNGDAPPVIPPRLGPTGQ